MAEQNFRQALLKYMGEQGFDPRDVAALTGVSIHTIRSWLDGKRQKPEIEQVAKICLGLFPEGGVEALEIVRAWGGNERTLQRIYAEEITSRVAVRGDDGQLHETFGGSEGLAKINALGFDPVEKFGIAWRRVIQNRPRNPSAFRFVILSGASAAGKDTLLDRIVRRDASLTVLKKRTTRQLRGGETFAKVEHTSTQEFTARCEDGRIIFPYKLQGIRYGFSTGELIDAIQGQSCICAVFTEFDLVPMVVKAMCSIGLPTKAFYLRAGETPDEERYELEIRTLQRPFDKHDRGQRLGRITEALDMIKQQSSFDDNYDVIRYGRSDSNQDATERLMQAIQEFKGS